jgi:hypothetical protein
MAKYKFMVEVDVLVTKTYQIEVDAYHWEAGEPIQTEMREEMAEEAEALAYDDLSKSGFRIVQIQRKYISDPM